MHAPESRRNGVDFFSALRVTQRQRGYEMRASPGVNRSSYLRGYGAGGVLRGRGPGEAVITV